MTWVVLLISLLVTVIHGQPTTKPQCEKIDCYIKSGGTKDIQTIRLKTVETCGKPQLTCEDANKRVFRECVLPFVSPSSRSPDIRGKYFQLSETYVGFNFKDMNAEWEFCLDIQEHNAKKRKLLPTPITIPMFPLTPLSQEQISQIPFFNIARFPAKTQLDDVTLMGKAQCMPDVQSSYQIFKHHPALPTSEKSPNSACCTSIHPYLDYAFPCRLIVKIDGEYVLNLRISSKDGIEDNPFSRRFKPDITL